MTDYFLSICIALTAMVMDIRFRRVNNVFLLISFISVIVAKTIVGDLKISLQLLGAFFPIILFAIPFFYGFIGAGDIKLLCTLGFIFGIRRFLIVIVLIGFLSVPEYVLYRIIYKNEFPFCIAIFTGTAAAIIYWIFMYGM